MEWEQSSTVETQERREPAQMGVVLFLVLTALVFLCYLTIFINPHIPFNPFPPPRAAIIAAATAPVVGATPTNTPTFTPSSTWPPPWTPTHTPTPTATFTPSLTPSPAPPTPTSIPLPAFTLRSKPIFVEQLLYPDASNWWTGLAGEVSDRNGQPVTDVTIKVWDDEGHAWETEPGGATAYVEEFGTAYGGGGTYAWWEQVLKASCHESIAVHVQVIRNGKPASQVVDVKTTADCEKNLVIIHFQKNY